MPPLNLNARNREVITEHRQKAKPTSQVVKETIDKFRSIHLRDSDSDSPGLEAIGVVVVEHDNLNYLDGRPEYQEIAEKYERLHKPSRVAPAPPGLRIGDPLNYRTMIQRTCNAYR